MPHLRPALPALLCALLCAACAARVDLSAPRRADGTTIRTELTAVVTDAKATLATTPLPTEASLTMVDVAITELTQQESSVRAPSRYQLSWVADRRQGSLRMPSGETRSFDRLGPFAGRVLHADAAGAQWRRSLLGAAPTVEQQAILAHPWSPPDLYPHEALRPGDSWQLSAAGLRQLVRDEGAQNVSGKVKGTWQRGVRCAPHECASIELEGQLAWQVRDEAGELAKVTWKVRGHRLRDLTTFVDRRFELHGVMRREGKMALGAQRVGVVVEGVVAETGKEILP